MKRRSKKLSKAINAVGEIAQSGLSHTGRRGRPSKKVLSGEAFEEIKRLEKELVKKSN